MNPARLALLLTALSFPAFAQTPPAAPGTPLPSVASPGNPSAQSLGTSTPLAPPPGYAPDIPQIVPNPPQTNALQSDPGQTAPQPAPSGPPAAPTAPGQNATGQTPPALPPTGPFTPAPPVPQIWQSRPNIDVIVLDKTTGRATTLSGKVGDALHMGALTVTASSCFGHPPDERQDSAAFLDIIDSHPGAPAFHGWMLAAEPALSMMQNPLYDVHVAACRP